MTKQTPEVELISVESALLKKRIQERIETLKKERERIVQDANIAIGQINVAIGEFEAILNGKPTNPTAEDLQEVEDGDNSDTPAT